MAGSTWDLIPREDSVGLLLGGGNLLPVDPGTVRTQILDLHQPILCHGDFEMLPGDLIERGRRDVGETERKDTMGYGRQLA